MIDRYIVVSAFYNVETADEAANVITALKAKT